MREKTTPSFPGRIRSRSTSGARVRTPASVSTPIRVPVPGPAGVLVALVTALLASASCASASPASLGQAAPDTLSTLQVSGSAQVEVETDRARVDFAVETEAETAQEASRENAGRMESVLAALRETGLPGLELETREYSLRPRYRRPDAGGVQEIDGFTASNTVVATMDDPTRAGALIDAGIEAGANRVASLTFLASDTEEARLQALRDAVAAARTEAEAIAGALGMTLGEPLEVSGGADRTQPPSPFRMEAANFQDAPTPVEPGTQTVSASVTIRYALREGAP